MTLKDYMNKHDAWSVACKLLERAATRAIGLHIDDLPDTPEMDELRQQLHVAVQDYKNELSSESFGKVLDAYNDVKDELASNIEDYVL